MDSQPRPPTTVDFLKAQGEASSHAARDTPDEQLQRSSSPGHNSSLGSSPTMSSKKRYRTSDDEEDPTDKLAIERRVKDTTYLDNMCK